MHETIASDILCAQIAELRQRIKEVEQQRDEFRGRAYHHAQNHRTYRNVARECEAIIATLTKQASAHERRITAAEAKIHAMIRGRIVDDRIVPLRAAQRVTRPTKR